MSKPIVKGDKVIIVAMDSKGVWGSKEDREEFMRIEVELVKYSKRAGNSKGWKYIEFMNPYQEGHLVAMFAKVRRVKK